jgi:cytochrome b
MKDILGAVFTGITALPKAFGQNPIGGIMTVALTIYVIHVGAPIVSGWLKIDKPEPKVNVNKLEGKEDGSGGVFEVEAN